MPLQYAWDDDGAGNAKALTTSYAASTGLVSIDVTPFNTVTLAPVLSGTATTSVELQIYFSVDNGTNYAVLPSAAVAPTLISITCGEISLIPNAGGDFPGVILDVGAMTNIRVKRTGGAADSALALQMVAGYER